MDSKYSYKLNSVKGSHLPTTNSLDMLAQTVVLERDKLRVRSVEENHRSEPLVLLTLTVGSRSINVAKNTSLPEPSLLRIVKGVISLSNNRFSLGI